MLKYSNDKIHPSPDWDNLTPHLNLDYDDLDNYLTGPDEFLAFKRAAAKYKIDVASENIYETDAFIWGKGPSPDPRLTKIGGAPFLPLSHSWPIDDEGREMLFLAQVNFSDSLDLLPKIPGPMVLLFVKHDNDEIDNFHSILAIEKYSLVWITNEVYEANDSTASLRTGPQVRKEEFFGVRERIKEIDLMAVEKTDEYGALKGRDYAHYSRIHQIRYTKIGGLITDLDQRNYEKGARFLCQLTSIMAPVNTPYPFVNDPLPLTIEKGERGHHERDNFFSFCDMTNLLILEKNGETYLGGGIICSAEKI